MNCFEEYHNLSGSSGVEGYRIGPDRIEVLFADMSIYLYTYEKPGRDIVEKMKIRAIAGFGLQRYITRQVGENYERKVRDKWRYHWL